MLKIIFLIATLVCNQLFSQVVIKGTVKNAKDSVITFSEPGGFVNATRMWRDKRFTVPIDKANRFSVALPEDGINTWLVETANGRQLFDLIKGKNIEVIADFSNPNPLTAIGKNAADFNYSVYAKRKDKRDPEYWKSLKGTSVDSVLTIRKKMSEYQISVLNEYKQAHNMSDAYYKWLKSKYIYDPYERVLQENIEDISAVNESTMNRLIENGINDEYAALNTETYNYIINQYIIYLAEKTGKPGSYFDFIAKGDLNGSTKDIQLTWQMAHLRTASDSVYNPQYKKYTSIVENQKLKKEIDLLRKEYTQPADSKNIAKETTLKEVFDKYKGKVIYVDFWASWCVPCRGEMPNAAKLKERLIDKDIVFVYLGYKDKERAWLKAKKDLEIKGEHYLLNETLIKEANDAFDIKGIPHYVIIDKEGNIVEKSAGRPRAVYEQLLKLSEK